MLYATSYTRVGGVREKGWIQVSEQPSDTAQENASKTLVVKRSEFYTDKDYEVTRNLILHSIHRIQNEGLKVDNDLIYEIIMEWAEATNRTDDQIFMLDKIESVIFEYLDNLTAKNVLMKYPVALQSLNEIREANCVNFLVSRARNIRTEERERIQEAIDSTTETKKKVDLQSAKKEKESAFRKLIGADSISRPRGISGFYYTTSIGKIASSVNSRTPNELFRNFCIETLELPIQQLPRPLMTEKEKRENPTE